MDIKEAIAKAADRIDLSEDEAKSVMEIMLSGEATQAQIAAFLTALRMKGETLDELVLHRCCGIRQRRLHRRQKTMSIW